MRVIFAVLLVIVLALPYSARSVPNGEQTQCVQPPPGLIAWWRGEQNGRDQQGLYHATINGATFAPGYVGSAWSLDGVDDTLVVDGLPLDTQSFTYESWIYLDQIPAGRQWADLFVAGETFTEHQGRNLLLNLVNKRLTVFPDILVSTISIVPQQWYHFAYTSNVTRTSLYIFGSLQDTNIYTPTTISSQRITIGNWPTYNEYWPGKIDELSFYNRALSADEIRAIASAGSAGKCAGSKTMLPFVRK